jgi:hypothetical protein
VAEGRVVLDPRTLEEPSWPEVARALERVLAG